MIRIPLSSVFPRLERSDSGITLPDTKCQVKEYGCRCKMRMSGLSKVEMSAFIGGRGPHGNGANRLQTTRTGPPTRATRDKAEADHAARITGTAIKPQISGALGAEDFAPGAATLCGLRTHPGRRAVGPGGASGEPGDAEQVDGEGQLVLPSRATRSYPSPHSAFRAARGCVTEKLALARDSQVECGFA